MLHRRKIRDTKKKSLRKAIFGRFEEFFISGKAASKTYVLTKRKIKPKKDLRKGGPGSAG